MTSVKNYYRRFAAPHARHWYVIYGLFVLVVANAGLTLIWGQDPGFGYSTYRATGLAITAVIFLAAPVRIATSLMRYWLAAVFIAWSLITIFWAPLLPKAILQGIQIIALFVVAMGMVIHLGRAASATVVGGALTLACGVSLLLMIFVPSIAFVEVLHTESGATWNGSGVFGWNSELGIAAALALTLSASNLLQHFRIRTAAYLLVNAATLYLSDSATAILAAAAGIAMMIFIRWRAVRYIFGVGVVTGIVTGFMVGWTRAVDMVLGIFGRSSNLTGREAIWQATLGEIAKRPLQGYGLGAFADYKTLIGRGDVNHAHNGYLQITYERGYIGLALLIIMIAMAVIWLLHRPHSTILWSLPLLTLLIVANYANNFTTGVTLAAFVLIWILVISYSIHIERLRGEVA